MNGYSLRSTELLKTMAPLLQEALTNGAIRRELVETTDLRMIGKTTQLVEFAKKYDLLVVVYHEQIANLLRRDHGDFIYSLDELNKISEIDNNRVVIDEGVDFRKVSKDFEIITGYIDYY